MVGALLTDEAGEIAVRHHERAGKPHAEAAVIEQAGTRARGATLFVTLEPCVHHGRTPPCVEAIIEAGIARVVVAAEDPDKRVAGQGIRLLRAAGIEVHVGLCEAQARDLNRAYYHQRLTGLPYVTLKMAQSLDGAVGARLGETCRLTGERAAMLVRSLRYDNDVVMIGVGTALADDPQLTVRPSRWRAVPYLRVVVDSHARLPLTSKLVTDVRQAKTLVACVEDAEADRRRALEDAGVGIVVCAQNERGGVDLLDLLRRLGRQGTLSVLCEGGPTLAGSLLQATCVDELQWLVAPVILGTASRAPVIAATSQLKTPLRVRGTRRLGDDMWISAVRGS